MLSTEWGVVVKRIVLVEFPPSGGLFQFALQLGEALAKDGDRVDVITGPSPELDAACAGLREAFAARPRAAESVDELIGWAQARASR